MNTKLYTIDGGVAKDGFQLDESVFGANANMDLIHQSIRIYEGNQRTNAAHVKDRAEVRGGGRKPWRQKGTGRARAGSNRSPIWIGGGKSHGARNEKSYKGTLPKKMRQAALRGTLTEKLAAKELFVVEAIAIPDTKTKQAYELLAGFLLKQGSKRTFDATRVLIVTQGTDESLKRATKNLKNVTVTSVSSINPYLLLTNKYVIVTKGALETIHQTFGNQPATRATT